MINMSELIEFSQKIINNSKQIKVDTSIRKPYVVTRRRFYNDQDYIGSIESCITWGYLRIDYDGNIQEFNEPNLSLTGTIILDNYIDWLRLEIESKLEKI